MMKMLKKNKGFTLIEIIVVIVILAVLMAVAVPSVMSYINEGKDAKYETVARGAMVNAQVQLAKVATGENANTDAAMTKAIEKTNEDSGDLEVTKIKANVTDKKITSYSVVMQDSKGENKKTATVTVNKNVTIEDGDKVN
ncbi:MAG: prepilin-type N-terminal cleavage/methylation domain-containing protein [Sharpea porci]|uniref:prepilin-type N-terminal cleavage/methylation domain-containing protein n=1 Tax=Sharpea porci TaxID=2652286 RepID=UPI00240A9483|nr:prepilin-type N-terminal cleavage/methylation domain-containing protein [Sharpea porci]MDD6711597.1 prepilin-type N-terminal cleavage/methylation domain-containing protein [Sharpea porci]